MNIEVQAIQLVVQLGQLVAFIVAAFKVGRWTGAIESRVAALEDQRRST